MRTLRYLFAIALVCGLARVAKADDFQAVVVDPTPNYQDVNQITNASFGVTLSACDSSQLPTSLQGTFLSCFTGLNETGVPLTSLQVLIPVFDISPGVQDTPGCPQVTGDIFTNTPLCGVTSDGLDFFVDFSGGTGVPTARGVNGDCDNDGDGGSNLDQTDVDCNQDSIFTIAVAIPNLTADQIDADFVGTVADANVVPEPNSMLLMSTGVLSLGLFGAYRRREFLLAPVRRVLTS